MANGTIKGITRIRLTKTIDEAGQLTLTNADVNDKNVLSLCFAKNPESWQMTAMRQGQLNWRVFYCYDNNTITRVTNTTVECFVDCY